MDVYKTIERCRVSFEIRMSNMPTRQLGMNCPHVSAIGLGAIVVSADGELEDG